MGEGVSVGGQGCFSGFGMIHYGPGIGGSEDNVGGCQGGWIGFPGGVDGPVVEQCQLR